MIRYLRQATSLKNLRSSLSGQISTLLILIMVVVLIFILFTVNLGNLSLVSLQLSNTADGAALLLGSQLASKANYIAYRIFKANDGGDCSCSEIRCDCKKSIWEEVMALIFIIVYVAVCIFYPPAWSAASYVIPAAGTVGGATGGSISGDGWGQGALKGLAVGLAVSGGMGVIKGLGAGLTIQAGGSIALTAAGDITLQVLAGKNISTFLSSLSKALSGLEEREAYRETVFLQAFSQTVDDPNEVEDTTDIDGDGDLAEKIPVFLKWWEGRVGELKTFNDRKIDRTRIFLHDLNRLRYAMLEFPGAGYGASVWAILGRAEDGGGGDGPLIWILRATENIPDAVDYVPDWLWKEGEAGEENDFRAGADKRRHDEISAVEDEFWTFSEEDTKFVETIGAADFVKAWESQIKPFYQPGQDNLDDIYDTWLLLINGELVGDPDFWFRGLERWVRTINNIKWTLPDCQIGHLDGNACVAGAGENDCYINPPCKVVTNFGKRYVTASIDKDVDDEYDTAITWIRLLEGRINEIRELFKDYYEDMQAINNIEMYGGRNPASYRWADSRCPNVPDSGDIDDDEDTQEIAPCHEVKVEVSDFPIPWVEDPQEYWAGATHHWVIHHKNYEGNGSNTWVEITRKLPVNKETGVLGKWNPFVPGEIKKRSKAGWRYDHLELTR